MITGLVFSGSAATSNITSYPSGSLNRATYFKTMFDTTLLPYNKIYNARSGSSCYTTSK
jgi:hypothetical protein